MKHHMSIQWHITTACQNKCKHCYVFDEKTYPHEKDFPLRLEEKIKVLDRFDEFSKKWDIHFDSICLMGGDPLRAPDFFPFAEELKRRGKTITMGGNPDCLTEENLQKLQQLGIRNYQISLDGLEKTHDTMRRKGSFKASVEGYAKLARFGIKGTVMATLTPLNIDEFFELIDFVFYHTEAKGFAFDFVSSVGEGKGFEVSFSPQQVLALSRRYLSIKKEYEKIKPDFRFAEKPGTMRLLRIEDQSYLNILDEGETMPLAGCLIGNDCIPILSDGTILSCRRFPEILGHLPKDKLEDILLGNETLKKYRRPQFFPECGNCIGWNICKGCPAISYGETKDPFKAFSLCYAHLLRIDTYQEHKAIPMNTTYEQEADILKNSLATNYVKDRKGKTLSPLVPDIVGKLITDEAYKKDFLKDRDAFFERECPQLAHQQRQYIIYRYNYLQALGE